MNLTVAYSMSFKDATTCWLRRSDSFGATIRAYVSVPPPAVKPTINRIGRFG